MEESAAIVRPSVATHKKTQLLANLLGISAVEAVGHLVCFWTWAVNHTKDGDLSEYTIKSMERASLWTGKQGEFIRAMCKAGYLDGVPEEDLRYHDFREYSMAESEEV